MKKYLSVAIMMIMLCCMCCVVLAEESIVSFDKEKLTGSPLYSYDKFAKKWNIQGVYIKEYSDARVEVHLLLFSSYVEKEYGPELRVKYFDKENDCYDTVSAFRVIIGETLYSFEKLVEGSAFSCLTLEKLCNALIDGEAVAFQLVHEDKYGQSWTATIDPVDIENLNELISMAKLLKESNAWSIDPNLSMWDAIYNASVE